MDARLADSRCVQDVTDRPGPLRRLVAARLRPGAQPQFDEQDAQSRTARMFGVILWGYALTLLVTRVERPYVDFPVLYSAGSAVLHGKSLYTAVPAFWYPPFAAAFFAPWALLSESQAASVYAWVQVCLPTAAAALVGVHLSCKHRLLASGLCAVLLLNAAVFADKLFIGNPSLLLLFPLVVIVAAWCRGRWVTGALVLGLTLAIKPMLLLLLAMPLLRRQFKAVGCAVAVAVATNLLALPLAHDWARVADLPIRVATARDMHGSFEVYDVSLRSVGLLHPAWSSVLLLLRVALGTGVLVLLWRTRKWTMTFSTVMVVAGALALCLPVVGSLNEVHYCVLALPACWCMAKQSHGVPAQVLALAALAVLSLDLGLGGVHLYDRQEQVRWALGSALALGACCIIHPERQALRRSWPRLHLGRSLR